MSLGSGCAAGLKWLAMGSTLCGLLGAQRRPAAELQQELQHMRKELGEAEVLERRLIDLRIESDLGLAVDVARYLTLADAERGRDHEQTQAEIERVRQETATLQEQLAELSERIEVRRRQLVEQAQAEPIVPQPSPPPLAIAKPATQPAAEPASPPALPLLESSPATGDEEQPQPPIDYIKGSRDHSKVGRALFRAAKYEKAIAELTQATDGPTPELIDLFYLARCHEKLGALERADDLFARIEALDSREDEDGRTVLGGWASAAHTARQHMSWQRDRGDWQPKLPIESIQWKKR